MRDGGGKGEDEKENMGKETRLGGYMRLMRAVSKALKLLIDKEC